MPEEGAAEQPSSPPQEQGPFSAAAAELGPLALPAEEPNQPEGLEPSSTADAELQPLALLPEPLAVAPRSRGRPQGSFKSVPAAVSPVGKNISRKILAVRKRTGQGNRAPPQPPQRQWL